MFWYPRIQGLVLGEVKDETHGIGIRVHRNIITIDSGYLAPAGRELALGGLLGEAVLAEQVLHDVLVEPVDELGLPVAFREIGLILLSRTGVVLHDPLEELTEEPLGTVVDLAPEQTAGLHGLLVLLSDLISSAGDAGEAVAGMKEGAGDEVSILLRDVLLAGDVAHQTLGERHRQHQAHDALIVHVLNADVVADVAAADGVLGGTLDRGIGPGSGIVAVDVLPVLPDDIHEDAAELGLDLEAAVAGLNLHLGDLDGLGEVVLVIGDDHAIVLLELNL